MSASAGGSDRASAASGCTFEVLVPGDERRIGAECKGARKVNGVVSAEFELLGKLTRLPRERAVDPDQCQLTLDRLELFARVTVPRRAEPPRATGRSERRTALGIAQDAGRRPKWLAPQLARQLGARLLDEELDEC